MQISLHIGAHRTGTTSFQTYMRRNAAFLAEENLGFWGPVRLRGGVTEGIIPKPRMVNPARSFARAQGRIKLHLARSAERGVAHVIVSEENILGTLNHNFNAASLYPSAGERLARFVAGFGPVSGIAVTIRSLDTYWTSALTYTIIKGFPVAGPGKIQRLAAQTRDWRDVITDLARAAPGIPIHVNAYERVAGQPHHILGQLTGTQPPPPQETIWRNARPTVSRLLQLQLEDREMRALSSHARGERWQPLDASTQEALRERYLDDIFWLRAGADGLATFNEDIGLDKTGLTSHLGPSARGQRDEQGHRLARPG